MIRLYFESNNPGTPKYVRSLKGFSGFLVAQTFCFQKYIKDLDFHRSHSGRMEDHMKKSRGASLLSLKALNQLQIRRSIYYNAPVTRQQIADQLGVSLPTVTTNVAQMLADGHLEEYTRDSSP